MIHDKIRSQKLFREISFKNNYYLCICDQVTENSTVSTFYAKHSTQSALLRPGSAFNLKNG